MVVTSFWVHRPEEFPAAADYPTMLQILQRSCDRLGLAHVCLTDRKTRYSGLWPERVRSWIGLDIPEPLMRACTEVQAQWLASIAAQGSDTLFVGADCIMRKVPTFSASADMAVTYRDARSKYPINTGAVFVRARALKPAAALFRRIADRCGPVWCDDQRAIRAELEPMPAKHGRYARAGMVVQFLPMAPMNVRPKSVDDEARGATMLHFRGKAHKQLLFDWAKRWGFS